MILIIPPLLEICFPINFFFDSFSDQNTPREQWEDPVAGSSSIPIEGAKNRETKSQSSLLAEAVTITHLHEKLCIFLKSSQ